MNEDLEKRTAQYIALRDKIKELEDQHAIILKPYKLAKEKLEGIFLQALDGSNADSIKTSAGTFYKAVHGSATIADAAEFQRYVIGSQAWELLDWRANKTAVAALVDSSGAAPPGVNYSTHIKVNVRRSGSTD
jgi:hypothetical protein